MPPRGGSLSVDDAWNAVALEERIELVSRAQAAGVMAAATYLLLIGATAYGFDKFWLLGTGSVGALLVMPLFASYSWRKSKPALILSYLAVRSVARRYAYGFNITDYDIVLIFRGYMEEIYRNEEEEQLLRQREEVDMNTQFGGKKEVWICLMRGGVVMLSEKLGGARLEMIAPVLPDCTLRRAYPNEGYDERALIFEGSGPSRGRTVVITSDYPGALYVFEKQIGRLLAEVVKSFERLQVLKRNQEAAEQKAFFSQLGQ